MIIAVCAGAALAHIGTTAMPFQVGALVDGGHLTLSQAGMFAFCQVAGLAVAMVLISTFVVQMRPALTGILGGGLACAANAALFHVHPLPEEFVLGTLAGLGFGSVFTATIAGAAGSLDADQVYSAGMGAGLLVTTLLLATFPLIIVRFGPLGTFLALSGMSLVSLPLFAGFRAPLRGAKQRATWQTAGGPGLLFSWVVFSMGTSTVYVFAERIGRAIHLAATSVGLVLSSGVLIGVLGTVLATLLHTLDRRISLLAGLLGSGLACLALGCSSGLALFIISVYLLWISMMFLYCVLLGTAAALDRSGHLGSLGGGLERMGYATGAWIGGIAAERISYSATGILACGLCFLGVAVGYPSLFRALKSQNV